MYFKKKESKHKWFVSAFFFLVCSFSFAVISTQQNIPSINNILENKTPAGSTDSLSNAPSGDTTKLPYKYKDKGDIPYDNLQNDPGIKLAPPPSLKTEIDYNTETQEYDVHERMGAFETRTPYSMTPQEYADYEDSKNRHNYWKEKSMGKNSSSKSLSLGSTLPGPLENLPVDIKPQGAVELTFGGKWNRTFNPSLTSRQQKSFIFDFTNKIQMSITGKIGDRISMKVKYDTESQFDFENQMNLQYKGTDDEIIKKIEAGNITFPLNNSLIKGSQSLMGFKTDLQFGKLYISAVASQQRGSFSTINVDKGAQKQTFKITCDQYDANKHYFLATYFRNHYEDAFKTEPVITEGIIIRRVEIWVTQTSTGKDNARNILALTDLGENKVNNTYNYNAFPSNQTDEVYRHIKNLQGIRDISQVSNVMGNNGYTVGKDYEKVELAVKLNDNQYTINNKLGYISLKTPIDPAKVLAIAYEYEYKGKVYQVGEFSSDGVVFPNVLIVKLLKSSQINPSFRTWNLMMKNVYSLGGYQINKDNFLLDILYQDPHSGHPLSYIPAGKIKERPLLSVMNLDTISANNEPYPDGMFDFIDGFTVNAAAGLVIFPVLEPFGGHLKQEFGDTALASQYCYYQLYDSTLSVARQDATHNKFLISGSYKSSSSNDISLNATQVQPGSVVVTAGGRKLVEGVDYTVDYTMGRVKIINQGLMDSGTPISVSLENNPLLNLQTKNFLGARFDYKFSKNFTLGATILHLAEIPLTKKVSFDNYPIDNTIWGLDGSYTSDAPFLTRLVNQLPFIRTKEKSTITTNAEFAQLIPGESKYTNGAVEIDYFENSEQSISLQQPTSWTLASTPQYQTQTGMFPEGNLMDNLEFGYNRAQLAWFDINATYFFAYNSSISTALQSDLFSHAVLESSLFPNYQSGTPIELPLTMINLAYYPYERGPYNYDVKPTSISAGLDPQTGRLKNPTSRWGGIMRPLTTTDFEDANVQYLQFWLMDPFITDSAAKNQGGDMYFDLGLISEDLMRDGKKFEENGLKNDTSAYTYTAWGRVPTYEVVQKGFDNTVDRADQDVGLDGLNDYDEKVFFADYLSKASQYGVNPQELQALNKDPSHDDFVSYLDSRWTNNFSIFERYHYYNGTEDNSPVGNNQGTGILTPDVEDINQNNTLDEAESYYQYKISIRRQDMEIGKNYIVDKITENANLPNKTTAKISWYQFRIPINSDLKQRIGNISDFTSIQFMRMFLKGFNDSIFLRLAQMSLVRSNWRVYDNTLYDAGEYDLVKDGTFNVSAVSFEQNNERRPVNYILPPGVQRTIDPMNPQLVQQDESSLMLDVEGLADGTAKAIYKTLNKDLRPFGNLQMYVHAEAIQATEHQLKDGDVTAFIRVGSDYTDNYYEYEIPLKLTPLLAATQTLYQDGSASDKLIVWPEQNNFNIDLQKLVAMKELRDKMIMQGSGTSNGFQSYMVYSQADGSNKMSVKGNPNLGAAAVIMIGIRNPKKTSTNPNDDGQTKSVIVWVDECRLTNINNKSGWAATASTRMNFADFATLSVSGSTTQPGFGGIDQQIFNRSLVQVNQYSIASNMALNKFFPEKLGLQLPFYFGWSESFSNPLYDPLDPDVLLKTKLSNLPPDSVSYYKRMSQTYEGRLSYNFTNVKIVRPKPKHLHPLHINNFSLSYAFNRIMDRNPDYEFQNKYNNKLSLMYNYPIRAKNYEPFKKIIKSKNFALLGDFNFSVLPSQITIDNRLSKDYSESERRNLSPDDPLFQFPTIYAKNFEWDRNYNVKYNLTKSIKIDYTASDVARIDEPQGMILDDNILKEQQVFTNLQKGGTSTVFNQKIDVTYKLPINKLPFFDFITSNYKYGGTYNWTAGLIIPNSTLTGGNSIKNSNSQTIDGTFTFSKLYNRSKYLKEVDKRFSGKGKPAPKTENLKYTQNNVEILAFSETEIKHDLKTTDVKVTVLDKSGKAIEGKTKIIDANKITFTSEKDYENAQVVITGKREIKEDPVKVAIMAVVHTMMMFKTITVANTNSNGSYIPGYKSDISYFGLDNPFFAGSKPGWPYVFGYVPSNDNLKSTILNDRWIIDNDSLLNDKYLRTSTNSLSFKSSVEPFTSLKINLESQRTFSLNNTQYLSNNPVSMATSTNLTSGNFTITTNALKSNNIFDKSASDNAYNTFKANCLLIALRIAAARGGHYEINPTTGFPSYINGSDPDVLIPSFQAAYTGQDANKMYNKDLFIPLFFSVKDFMRTINWRFNYNGLSDLALFKKYFKSITISHAYQCTYSIASFQTFTSDNMVTNNMYTDLIDGNVYLAPKYTINSVSINERFNPIIGINTKLQNNFTTKFEIRNNRMVSLSLVNDQISEVGGFEYVFGLGYVFKDFVVIIKSAGTSKTYKHDITTNVDFSVRQNTTTQRTISDDQKQVISGQRMWSVKWYADYQMTKSFTIRAFMDWAFNQPLTNGYNTRNLSSGINLRFTLI